MALGSRPSAPAGRYREAAAQQPRCGGAALAAAAILAALGEGGKGVDESDGKVNL